MATPKPHTIGSAWDTGHYTVEPEELEALDAELTRHREREVSDPTLIPREVLLRVSTAINKGQFDPPRPPELALQMMRMAENPRSCAADLADLAMRDAFLSGRLLQLANSVQFGPRSGRIDGLREAITRLGMSRVRNVVLASAMRQNVYSGTRNELMTELWRASIGAAVGCRLISKVAGWRDERAFFTGLVHDMGKPVLVWVLDEVITESYPDLVNFDKLAPAIFHMLHCRVGAMIIRGWGLSPKLASILAHHHTPNPPEALKRPIFMLRMANLLYESWGIEGENMADTKTLRDHPRMRQLFPDPKKLLLLLQQYPPALKTQLQA